MCANESVAIRGFLDMLPTEMVELALKAVQVKEVIDETTDETTRSELQHKLELIKREIILSANEEGDHSMAS